MCICMFTPSTCVEGVTVLLAHGRIRKPVLPLLILEKERGLLANAGTLCFIRCDCAQGVPPLGLCCAGDGLADLDCCQSPKQAIKKK
jgi:hypothetical protein